MAGELDKVAAGLGEISELLRNAAWIDYDPPYRSGVYMLLGEDGVVAYVGKGRDVLARLAKHYSERERGYGVVTRAPWATSRYLLAPERIIVALEAILISEFQPPGNRDGVVDIGEAVGS